MLAFHVHDLCIDWAAQLKVAASSLDDKQHPDSEYAQTWTNSEMLLTDDVYRFCRRTHVIPAQRQDALNETPVIIRVAETILKKDRKAEGGALQQFAALFDEVNGYPIEE